MATTIDILKELTKKTNNGSIIWWSTVDGADQTVVGEEALVAPHANTNDGTYFAYVKLKNDRLIPNTFSAKIISAGQENQTAIQFDSNPNLVLSDTGTGSVKVTSARLDTTQGSVMLRWNGCNIEEGLNTCRGSGTPNENAHKLVANYNFQKKDSNMGTLGQIYAYGTTPWSDAEAGGRGCVVINNPRGKGSLIKTLKFISYNDGVVDWILEPESSTVEGKELTNLFNAITKQVAQPFATFIGL